MKLYLQEQVAGQIWPVGHNLFTPTLGNRKPLQVLIRYDGERSLLLSTYSMTAIWLSI